MRATCVECGIVYEDRSETRAPGAIRMCGPCVAAERVEAARGLPDLDLDPYEDDDVPPWIDPDDDDCEDGQEDWERDRSDKDWDMIW